MGMKLRNRLGWLAAAGLLALRLLAPGALRAARGLLMNDRGEAAADAVFRAFAGDGGAVRVFGDGG